ncbi:hypothetical protein BURPSPAST_AB0027 [Burkholderia pseudomallei Pasteur 52237]|nr:hypothetical protein BURPSPAST_AB0027 [Burkholderia pseudomallei Pasteur 52237]
MAGRRVFPDRLRRRRHARLVRPRFGRHSDMHRRSLLFVCSTATASRTTDIPARRQRLFQAPL